ELWLDEAPGWAGTGSCGTANLSLAGLPRETLDPLMESELKLYGSLDEPARAALRAWLFDRWVAGKRVSMPKLAADCGWRALSELHALDGKADAAASVLESCGGKLSDPMLAALEIEAGDRWLREVRP